MSDTGMKLKLTAPLELNERVAVALTPSIVLCGTVAWLSGSECGIAFDCPVDSEALLDAAEPAQRAPDATTLDLLGARQPIPGGDAADGGAPRSGRSFRPGLAVTVVVGPNQEERGVVRWANNRFAALRLDPAQPGTRPPARGLLPAPAR